MKAARYARVSTDKQAEKYGLPSQIEALRKRCLEKSWTPHSTPLRRSKGIAEKGDACEIWMFTGDITFPQYTLRFFWAGSNIF